MKVLPQYVVCMWPKLPQEVRSALLVDGFSVVKLLPLMFTQTFSKRNR